jgi:hypothetical protein
MRKKIKEERIMKKINVKKNVISTLCGLCIITAFPVNFHAAKPGESDFSGTTIRVRSQSAIKIESAIQNAIPVGKVPALKRGATRGIPTITKTLKGIEFVAPSTVPENSHPDYSAKAMFSDGSTQYVTTSAIWSKDSNWGDMDSNRRYRLKTGSVPSNQSITIKSIYEYNGMKKSAHMTVNIKNITPTYEVNQNNTTNGGGTLGPILKLKASVSGTRLTLTLTKKDGTPWTESGTVYFKVGVDQTNGTLREEIKIAPGKRLQPYTHNLTEHPGYPKQFYVRFKGLKGQAWVGPITVYER